MNSNYKLLKMLVSLFFVGATALRLSARESSANAVEFLREIQPILTAHC